jgi:tyrosyl-DNA phosphodiesterase 2
VPSIERFTYAPQVFTAGSWGDAPLAARRAPLDVRLVTWNVWFGGHMFDERRDALLAELQRRRPDVVALQEVTQELLAALLDEPWLRAAYQVSEREVTAYDVVILSRLPIRRISGIALPTSMGRRLVVAELACGLAVATVHLESTREEAPTRAAQLAIVQPALAERHDDVVLVGDMNFTPDDAVENAALDPAFVDVWPALHADEPGYTVDTVVKHDAAPGQEHAGAQADRSRVHAQPALARPVDRADRNPADRCRRHVHLGSLRPRGRVHRGMSADPRAVARRARCWFSGFGLRRRCGGLSSDP